MAGYVVVNYRVTDAEGIQQYVAGVMPTLAQHGAEVLVADHASQAIEGDGQPTTIVLKFPSVEAAKAWYDSPEYQAVAGHRHDNTADGRMTIAEGFVPPG